MTTAALDRPMKQTRPTLLAVMAAPPAAATSVSKASVLVGVAFLTATVTFAIANAVIHSYFPGATAHLRLIIGVVLLGGCGLAVVANGAAMRPVLAPHTPVRSRAYFGLRVMECLSLTGVGVYFLTGNGPWTGYLLAVYAVSGAAGLVLSSALLASRIVPRNLAMLGVVGYPVFLLGTTLAMFSVVNVTQGAGMLALVPGGLFELVLPMWLFTKGFTVRQVEG
jgi:hypothetical protein